MNSYLERHDPRRNLARYYRLSVLPNLFGEWTLERQWGRIGQRGRIRRDLFRTQSAANDALLALEAAKRQRGYVMEPQQLSLFP
ncbi:MAG: WGR domain-containing protein [Paracoccaceae bacterium]